MSDALPEQNSLQRLIQSADDLSLDDLAQVSKAIERRLFNVWAEEMAAQGKLRIPREATPEERAWREAFAPVVIQGGALSEEIIRDRR